jgi:pullulanase
LVLVVGAACGSGASTGRGADAAPTAVPITFQVQLPASTPPGSKIYLAGDFQGWEPHSPPYLLTETAPLARTLTLDFAVGTSLHFKLTRGSWASVEKGPNGEEVADRTHEVVAAATVAVTVASWADAAESTTTGDVSTITVPGFLAGRRVWVYLPPGYHQSSDRYPVLYMLDGQNVFDKATSFAGEWRVDETLESLIPAGKIRPLIVVAVDNSPARIDEYTPWRDGGSGGGADTHLTAIAGVLVPYIDTTYRTLTGPKNTGIAGSSLGGLMALYTTYARPEVFGVTGAFSPSIWWAGRRLVSYAAAATRPDARVWMDMGTAESASAIGDLETMRDAMVQQGFVLDGNLKVVEATGASHNEASWAARFPDAAQYLFPPR